MLSVEHRMREAEDFRIAMREGRRAGTSHLVVHLALTSSGSTAPTLDRTGSSSSAVAPTAPNPPAPPALVGFAVSKQVGTAVVRNRVRRRLRHLVRARIAELPAGSRVVVRALPGSAGASSTELAVSLDSAIQRASRPRRPARTSGPAPAERRPSGADGGGPGTTAEGAPHG